jgi:hypothetical protein
MYLTVQIPNDKKKNRKKYISRLFSPDNPVSSTNKTGISLNESGIKHHNPIKPPVTS